MTDVTGVQPRDGQMAGASAGQPPEPAVRLPDARQKEEFDLFISYSRKDKAFTRILYAALSSYRPPKTLPVPQRYLKVFLDENDAYGTDYEHAIHGRLKDSAKLLVVCSPNARASRFVDPEIRTFLRDHRSGEIISVLIDGLPNNETPDAADPRNAFPEALCAAQEMPLAIDYREFTAGRHRLDQGAYRNAWFTLLANIYGHSRAEIEERERKRQARQRRIRAAILSAVGAALLSLSIWALMERDRAIDQRDRALASRLAAQASLLLTNPQEGSSVPVLLAAHSFRYGQTSQAYRAIGEGMRRLPPALLAELPPALAKSTIPTQIIFSPRASHVAVMARYGVSVDLFEIASRRKVASLHGGIEDGNITDLVFSRSETSVAVIREGKGRKVEIFDLPTGQPLGHPAWRPSSSIAEGDDGWREAWIMPDRRTFVVADPASGRTILSAPVPGQATAAALSPDGRFAAAASGRHVRAFDLSRQAPISEFDLPAPVAQLAMAPGGDVVAVVHADGSGGVWSTRERQRKTELKLDEGRIRAVEFTPRGRYLRIMRERDVAMLEMSTLRPVVLERTGTDASAVLLGAQGVSGRNPPVALQFVGDENGIFIAREQGDLILWQKGLLPSFGYLGVLPGLAAAFQLNHGTSIVGASASEDGSRVVSFGTGAGMSPMGTMIVAPWTGRIWDAVAKQEIARITSAGGLIGAVSPSGDLLATAEPLGESGGENAARVRIWSLPVRRPPAAIPERWRSRANSLAVALDGIHLASPRGADSSLLVGTADAVAEVPPAPAEARPQGSPWQLAAFGFSGDSRTLFESSGHSLVLHDAGDPRRTDRLEFARNVQAVALSRDGVHVAVTHFDDELFREIHAGRLEVTEGAVVTEVWNVAQRTPLWTIAHRHPGLVRAVSQDGRRVLVQRFDLDPELVRNPMVRVGGALPVSASMEVWDKAAGRAPVATMPLRPEVKAPRGFPLPASFDAAGTVFAVVLDAHTAVVGSAQTGDEIATIEPYGRVAETFNPAAAGAEAMTAFGVAIGFSPDGSELVTAGTAGSAGTAGGRILSARYKWRHSDLVAAACARLPEGQKILSANEWRLYFADASPRPVCDGSPLEPELSLLSRLLRR